VRGSWEARLDARRAGLEVVLLDLERDALDLVERVLLLAEQQPVDEF
jgi:hypothetical protein